MNLLKELNEAVNTKPIYVKINGKVIGSVWIDDDGDWNSEHDSSGMSWGGIDSKEDAIEGIKDHHDDWLGR